MKFMSIASILFAATFAAAAPSEKRQAYEYVTWLAPDAQNPWPKPAGYGKVAWCATPIFAAIVP